MPRRSTQHATFDIERVYEASPARVFGAWASAAAKARWFGPSEPDNELTLDLQVDGREHFTEKLPDGRVFGYDARYHEIVPDRRISYSYTVDFDQTRISTSLVTVEVIPAGKQTHLRYTEQTAFFDGLDTPADRELGTRAEFKRLDAALSSELD